MSELHQSAELCSNRSLRRIELAIIDNAIMVVPAEGQPFHLPLMAPTMTDFVSSTCEHVWQVHGRCMGALLLFDLSSRQWSFHVPNQRAGRHAASWAATPDDLAGLPESVVIAGSFQSRQLQPDESPVEAVPPAFAGIHMVQVIDGDRRTVWSFASIAGSTKRVDASDVILDELSLVLRECDRRLNLL
jgi:hypothetical protein